MTPEKCPTLRIDHATERVVCWDGSSISIDLLARVDPLPLSWEIVRQWWLQQVRLERRTIEAVRQALSEAHELTDAEWLGG